jgi:hypothetical protein
MTMTRTHIAVPSPQSTNLTTKFTAGIQPDAHSFFSIDNLHPFPLLLLLLLVNGFRMFSSMASDDWSSNINPNSTDWKVKKRHRGGDKVMMMR